MIFRSTVSTPFLFVMEVDLTLNKACWWAFPLISPNFILQAHWWAVILISLGLIIFMGLFIKVCAVHTPSSNPKAPPAQHWGDTLRRRRSHPRRPHQHQQPGYGQEPLRQSVSRGSWKMNTTLSYYCKLFYSNTGW